ncbi:gluconate 2-dehydrogenase subunit 3 family protein [Paenibacillus sp. y28]|uniref:gluconate 2-dehydrogenase subunit 3 family protein n=1 Tax=Paenibacillus sp. y28 TaxID=3129110 RepID=UPI00301B1B61
MSDQHRNQPQDDSRRRFLKYSGTAIGGAIVGGVIGGVWPRKTAAPETPQQTPAPGGTGTAPQYNQALMFFNQEQFTVTEAAVERIYPEDENGPGAKLLGVAFYIDHQLASPWGLNAKEYRMGPFGKGETTQGEYASIKRHELFTMGLQAMQDVSKSKYGKPFPELSGEEQDEILKMLEKGEQVVISEITTKTFFNLLRQMTIEGAYSDPMYGGNLNMQGWKMRKYPGNQMSYTAIIDKDFTVVEPKSLHEHLAGH